MELKIERLSSEGFSNKSHALSDAIISLEINDAIAISGMNRSAVSARLGQIGNRLEPRRKFSTRQLADGRFAIKRIS